MEPEAEPPGEHGGLLHQTSRDREGRARRDHELGHVAVGERGQPLGVCEHIVDPLDQVVGREPAVGDAEIHRAARRDQTDAETGRGAQLGLDEALDAAREDVVVVEDGRAAGERELGKPGPRRGVEHLLVDPGPDRVERAKPGEEIRVLGPGPRQGLVEVVVGVDEPRCEDRPVEIVGGAGRLPPAELGDQAVLDPKPAPLVLGPLPVHRHHMGVSEDHARPGRMVRPHGLMVTRTVQFEQWRSLTPALARRGSSSRWKATHPDARCRFRAAPI